MTRIVRISALLLVLVGCSERRPADGDDASTGGPASTSTDEASTSAGASTDDEAATDDSDSTDSGDGGFLGMVCDSCVNHQQLPGSCGPNDSDTVRGDWTWDGRSADAGEIPDDAQPALGPLTCEVLSTLVTPNGFMATLECQGTSHVLEVELGESIDAPFGSGDVIEITAGVTNANHWRDWVLTIIDTTTQEVLLHSISVWTNPTGVLHDPDWGVDPPVEVLLADACAYYSDASCDAEECCGADSTCADYRHSVGFIGDGFSDEVWGGTADWASQGRIGSAIAQSRNYRPYHAYVDGWVKAWIVGRW